MQPRCILVIETHAALLNAIIRDRLQSKSKKRQPTPRVAPALRDQINGPDDMDIDDRKRKSVLASRDVLERFAKTWDKKIIHLKDSRKGWECVLIGCLYQVYKEISEFLFVLVCFFLYKSLTNYPFIDGNL